MRYLYLYFVFLFCAVQCNSEDEGVRMVDSIDINQNKFKQIQIELNDHGNLKAKIKGDSLYRIKDPITHIFVAEFKHNVVITIFDVKTGKQDNIITADYCKINEKTNYMFIKGNVYIETIQQDTIRTKDLTWDDMTELFTTKDSIEINRPTEKIKGIGFEGNSDLSDYKIFKPVGQTSNKQFEF